MMKRAIAVLICLLLVTACLSSCGGEDISGSYKLVSLTVKGQDMSESLASLDDVILVVDGKSAVLTVADEVISLTVDTREKTFTDDDGAISPYTLEGDMLTLIGGQTGSKLVFEKCAATADSVKTK